MNRNSRFILAFAVLFMILLVSPGLLSAQYSPYELMKWGDVVDIFTPLFLIPLYWLLFKSNDAHPITTLQSIIFLVLASLWVEGQGMHLAANSIGHQLSDFQSTDAYTLTKYYDEFLSHYLWHVGMVGMSALLIWRHWRFPPVEDRVTPFEWVAAVLYGLTYSIIIIEARTAAIGVPFAVLVVVFMLLRGRAKLRRQSLLAFFFIAYLLATILFAGWGVYWSGSECEPVLPEFSDPCVGWID